MEINEKKHKKEQQELIIRKYQQYLKLEKSLSLNTLDAYLTDLDNQESNHFSVSSSSKTIWKQIPVNY